MKNVNPTPYAPLELEIIELVDIVTSSGGYASDENEDTDW